MSDKKSSIDSKRALRLDGWGFVGESFAVSPALLDWLAARLGDKSEALPSFDPEAFRAPEPAPVPELGCAASTDAFDRLAHARGRGFPDLVHLRSGTVARLPDAVARPGDETELQSLLDAAQKHGLRIVPWGGGTSVTGGVNAPAGAAPVVTVDLGGFSGLESLDEESGLAVFGAGTIGPRIEAALGDRGFTLGHFPQSWELSTLGGWIATRSAGQESLGYGRIESMVAGLDLTAPGGRLEIPALPASAAGPDLRQLVLGSEGRFGVITRATMRVRRRPEHQRVEALLVPDWASGVEASRSLVQAGLPLSMLRLSDAPETEVAMAVGLGKSAWAPLARAWLRLRGIGTNSCLMLLGAGGTPSRIDACFERAWTLLRPHGAVSLGAGPGRHWLADRFRHPYLRDSLLDLGLATETLETAAPWSRLGHLYRAVGRALAGSGSRRELVVPVLCHLSHPYRDGASLYFTFFFRCPRDPDEAVAHWARLKRRATDAIVAAGGTLSHHHGVGSWHAPWLPHEAGESGWRALRRLAQELDPRGVLNSRVLLDRTDRLEE
ncbi:MAG: FAD-binding oxidoreductase [bacterium]|nr:FAD-binding oxidoreductase [bacterium]